VAKAAGVHRSTLWRWLKQPQVARQLEAFEMTTKQQKLPGKAVKLICNHYVIDINENA
jgi:transposase-like protein